MNGMMDWAIQHDAEVAAAAAEAERQRQAAEDQAQAEAAAAAAEAERKRLAAEQADDQQRNGVANPFDTASTDTGNPFARTPAKPSDVNKAIDDLLPAMQNIMDNNQSPPTATTDNPFTNTATTPPSTVTASNPFTDKTPTPDTSASNNDGNGSSEENKGIHLNFTNPFKPATAYAGDENNSGNTEPINNGKRVAHRDPNAPIPEEFTNDDPEKRREDEMNKMLEEERKKKLSPWQKAKEYVTGNKGDQPEDQPEDQPSQPKSTHPTTQTPKTDSSWNLYDNASAAAQNADKAKNANNVADKAKYGSKAIVNETKAVLPTAALCPSCPVTDYGKKVGDSIIDDQKKIQEPQ
jgi:hypothetical protein